MSNMKNLSRAGWVIVGLVAAMLLVPTMAVAATVAYNGIEGTNGTTTTLNKALVTSAGQLLTTQAQPSKYVEYEGFANGAHGQDGGEQCETASTIPSGEAFIAEQVEVDVSGVNSPDSYSSPTGIGSTSYFWLVADAPADAGDCDDYVMTTGEAPGGSVGNVAIPLVPGFVVPSGYHLDFLGVGINADIWIGGYLVPSADAPSTPNVTRMQANIASQQLHLSHR